MKIIGLSGYARSGKDTVASILVDEYGFHRVAFADKIREFLLEINPILSDGKRLNETVLEIGWENAKAQSEVRRLLQDTGIGARKLFGENFWITQSLREWAQSDRIVITDVRFKNEASTITTNHGLIWRVERDGVSPVNKHVSEQDMDNWDFDLYLPNNGTIEDLRFAVNYQMEQARWEPCTHGE